MRKHPEVVFVPTRWGGKERVHMRELKDPSVGRLRLYNQFGKPLKDDGKVMLKRRLMVYRENLVIPEAMQH